MAQIPQWIYSLYRITNLVNKKIYIGQAKDYDQRWRQHKAEAKKDEPSMVINKAMKKYGTDQFLFEVIASCLTWQDANEIETLLVQQYESHISTGKGYNVSLGGNNAPKTPEWIAKVSTLNTGKKRTEEAKKRISEAHKGIRHSEATRKAIGLAAIGNKHRLGLSSWNKNLPMSEDQKVKLSVANQGKHSSPETEIKKGQHISPATEIKKGERLSPSTEFKPGTVPWNKKISPAQEAQIMSDPRSSRVIAKEYSVDKSTILKIRRKQSRKDKEQ